MVESCPEKAGHAGHKSARKELLSPTLTLASDHIVFNYEGSYQQENT